MAFHLSSSDVLHDQTVSASNVRAHAPFQAPSRTEDMLNARFGGKRVLFVANQDTHFRHHSRYIAEHLHKHGAEVFVLAAETGLAPQIEASGFKFVHWDVDRKSINPIKELKTLGSVLSAYRRIRPHYAHHLALKAVLHGSIASKLLGIRSVNHVSGLGHLFIDDSRAIKLARRFVLGLLKFGFAADHAVVGFESSDDREFMISHGVVPVGRTVLTRGVGVDTQAFVPRESSNDVPIVLFAGRFLWTKGVREFVDAATMLKTRGVVARFVLVGQPDPGNPASIPQSAIDGWVADGIVEDWGFRSDMSNVLASADVFCLPSYKEGIPRVLLEAGACSCPVVATDIPGIRDLVRHNVSGLLVPPRSVVPLADALQLLISDSAMRLSMGVNGLGLVTAHYDVRLVTEEIASLFSEDILALERAVGLSNALQNSETNYGGTAKDDRLTAGASCGY